VGQILGGQLDFIFFFYGLAFILAAGVCLALVRNGDGRLAWAWLGLFCLVHGVNEWLDLVALVLGSGPVLDWIRRTALVGSFLALLEFARRGDGRQGRRRLGPWVHLWGPALLILAATLESLPFGPIARYSLGLPAAAWAGIVLFTQARRPEVPGPGWLLTAAVAMGLYAVATGLVVPAADLPPACWVNYQSFSALAGVPIQLIRGLLACVTAAALWQHLGRIHSCQEEQIGLAPAPSVLRFYTPMLLVIALAAGWWLTEFSSSRSLHRLRRQSREDVEEIASHLDRKVRYAVSTTTMIAQSPAISADLFGAPRPAQVDTANQLLDRFSRKFPGSVCYILDAEGTVLYSSNRGRADSFVGKNYAFRSYFRDAMGQGSGAFIGMGVTSGKSGLYASSAVRGPSGPVGVVVLKQDLHDMRETVSFHQEALVVNSAGRILLSANPDRLFGQAWPLGEQPGPGTLLDAPVRDNQLTRAEGRLVLTSARHLNTVPAWQVVLLRDPEAWRWSRWLGMSVTLCVCLLLLAVCIGDSAARAWGRKLAKATCQFESLVSCSPNFVAMLDGSGRFCRVNPRGADMLARPQEEIVGRDILEVFGPGARPVKTAAMHAACEGLSTSCEIDWQVQGRPLLLDAMFRPVGSEIPARHVVMVANDVTQRKLAVEEAQAANANAQRANEQLRQRARQLERARQAAMTMCDGLEQARAEAVAANETKGQFLANVSHEFRTPLNGILGLTELTLQTELTDEQREYLDMVQASAESLRRVVEDLLDFSRIDANKLTLSDEPFEIHTWFWDLLKAETLTAERKGLQLVGRIDADVPARVIGDPGRLGQVLVNLLSNALKFTDDGQVCVRIEHRGRAENKHRLRFSVTDSGIGISSEQIEQIFSAFHQADGSATRKHGGTGLGLSICRQLVGLMGGTVEVQSQPGQGAVFSFQIELPADQDAPAPCDGLTGRRILIAEPNAVQRQALVEMAEQMGLETVTAQPSDDLPAMLAQAAESGRPCPLVLLDTEFAGDTIELARQITESDRFQVRLAMMARVTAGPEQAESCRQAGALAVLHKPLSRDELARAVCGCLDLQCPEAEPDRQDPQTQAQESQDPADLPRLRILVAEDNPVNQRLATILLQRRGHEPICARNGMEAVEIWKQQEIDLVLMDVQMPEMDGLAATREIRRIEWAGGDRRVPIIAMTAHAMARDQQRCLQGGMDYYLSKPIRAEQLFEMIQRAVQQEPRPARPPVDEDPAGQPTDQALPFDLARALRHLDGNMQLLEQLGEMALEELPAQLECTCRAVGAGDCDATVDAALVLASTADSLAAWPVSQAAKRLAQLAEEGDWECVNLAHQQLQQHGRALREALADWIGVRAAGH
jgi:PAS domain S-box-containing protein